ncbi:ATP-dependent Clp protease adapter ClpS [Rhodococcoides corynebacterioides]|uniref:ATP-dependent Clp protease adapter protein ClpS n=1 Tax=Rhodococcoides corynebacterioides TaxID=53972 RepID=A0ABS7P7J5_9NOCA|nr:ATP-dependent Clp protease adapter ClpS [Rhodococcus corynebacterioides]MBY6368285.1 ATP-dependent Clp protease adapter ClpS [Rhodococcus corynebacterioides]MBY6409055.1 ATP-dependent Clp protease adapter ClpS [Rhodococcus corynebacterioides]
MPYAGVPTAGPAPLSTLPQASPEESVAVAEDTAADTPWVTIVWDDPVNLMHYVTYVFQKVFGYSKDKATELMMQVHSEGKAVVSSGPREKMETDVAKLHAAGLWATMQHDV